MPALNDDIKAFVVMHLAVYDSPQQVADAVKEEFGVEITRQQVRIYDPTSGPKPARKWCKLFDDTRREFLDRMIHIPVTNRAVRIRGLERMYRRAEHRGNYPLAAQLLEQIAKEVGDVYTNRQKHEHMGKDGNPFVAGVTVIVNGEKVQDTADPKKVAEDRAA